MFLQQVCQLVHHCNNYTSCVTLCLLGGASDFPFNKWKETGIYFLFSCTDHTKTTSSVLNLVNSLLFLSIVSIGVALFPSAYDFF